MTELQQSSEGEARARVRKIRAGFTDVVAWVLSVTTAFAKRDWTALGYESWDAYTDAEYGDLREQLPPALRPQVFATMRAENMDVRAIAAATGSSRSTVSRTLKSGEELSHRGTTDSPTAISGGRAYERSMPKAIEADPVDEGFPAWARPMPARQDVAEEILERIDRQTAAPKPAPVMLTLRTHTGEEVAYPKPASRATFNETTGDGISWAAWSWNPVTGCLHGCDYCYARAIANRFTDGFPAGFTPLFHHERLDAPANTVIPAAHRDDPAYRRVFVCSMADLYGRWVPDEWIGQVHASMLASPQWEYLLLTKFPARYVGLDLPPSAWVGTSVDEQKRVRIAEDAFRKIDGVKVKWLSLEPLKEPLEFTDLSMFDWVVIGAQTETRQPDGTVAAFDPPADWVIRITAQAREAGCQVHWKPNLRRSLWYDQYPEL